MAKNMDDDASAAVEKPQFHDSKSLNDCLNPCHMIFSQANGKSCESPFTDCED